MRHFFISIAFAVLSFGAFAEPDQNSEPVLTPLQQGLIDKADAVALVEVNHVSSLINRALSFPGMLSVQAYSYQLSPHRQWKGQIQVGDELRIKLRDCTQALQKGEKYIVMMSFDGASWVSKQCEQVVAIGEAQPVLAYLNRIEAVQLAQQ